MNPPDFSPSAEQNKHPILEKLLQLLPAQGAALEIASGTGQHAAWFARHLPGWRWQPTEVQPDSLPSIRAHVAHQVYVLTGDRQRHHPIPRFRFRDCTWASA